MGRAEGDTRNGQQHQPARPASSRDSRSLLPTSPVSISVPRRLARRSGLLLASSSAAALIIGGAPRAVAAPCAINITSGTVASESTAANVNCINIQNATVTGNVTNTSPFIVAPTGGSINNAILINGATVGGSVVNAGTITAPGDWAVFLLNSNAAGGVSNSGTISANSDIFFETSSFSGGVRNSGTLSSTGTAINVNNVATFAGGVSNSGTISATNYDGIAVWAATLFVGYISNSGRITAGSTGIYVTNVSTFTGGITNSGTISSSSRTGIVVNNVGQFSAGIGNSGTIAVAAGSGIVVSSVSTFAGGIANSNGGTISAGNDGISVTAVSQFGGGIVNGGTIQANSAIGINVSSVSFFSEGIVNAGKISAAHSGIAVSAVTTFTGGISNSGTISSLTGGRAGIALSGVNQFTAGIGNSGAITAAGTGIRVSNVSTFGGGIGNSGSISAHGSDIYVAGVSTFTDGITNAGTISANAGIYINRDSAVAGVSNAGTISAAISNSGRITASTYGIYANNISSFAGGISNSGAIAAGNYGIIVGRDARSNGAASNSTFSGGIRNSGTISATGVGIYINNVSTFAGNISNTGTIVAATAVSIAGAVTFAAGNAIVNSGMIAGSAAAIDTSTATSAVTIDQTGGTIHGAIKLSSNADVLNISGGTINGNIIGAGSHDTVNFSPGAGNSFTYASNFTGINQVNINSGTVILNGSNVASSVDVNGGTLAGTGTLDPLAVTIHSGATLQPGAPGIAGGRLSIVGNLAFQSGAIYLITINGTNASSANVTGLALLGGAQVSVASGSAVIAGHKYTILTDTGGGLGGGNVFANAVGYGALRGTLSYDADDVYVTFNPATLRSLLPSPAPVNPSNVAAAIDHVAGSGGTLPAGFQSLFNLSPAQLQGTLTQLSGEVATGAERSALQMTTRFLDLMLDPFVFGRSGNNPGGPALGFAQEDRAILPDEIARPYASVIGKAPPASFAQRWSAWGSAYGGSSTANGDAIIGSNSITASTFGFGAGMDYRFAPSALAGFALAGGGTNWGLANGLGSGRSDAMQAGGYAVSWHGPAYVAGSLAFSNHWFTTNRVALADPLTAAFTGQSYGTRLEGGYRLGVLSTLGVTPYGAVVAQYFHTPAYRESDPSGAFGLSYGATNATDVRSEIGARFDAPTLVNGKPVVLYGRLAWARDFVGNPRVGAAFETLPGASFTVYGAPISRDSALTSAGAKLYLTANWSLIGTFDGSFASGSQNYGTSGTVRYAW